MVAALGVALLAGVGFTAANAVTASPPPDPKPIPADDGDHQEGGCWGMDIAAGGTTFVNLGFSRAKPLARVATTAVMTEAAVAVTPRPVGASMAEFPFTIKSRATCLCLQTSMAVCWDSVDATKLESSLTQTSEDGKPSTSLKIDFKANKSGNLEVGISEARSASGMGVAREMLGGYAIAPSQVVTVKFVLRAAKCATHDRDGDADRPDGDRGGEGGKRRAGGDGDGGKRHADGDGDGDGGKRHADGDGDGDGCRPTETTQTIIVTIERAPVDVTATDSALSNRK